MDGVITGLNPGRTAMKDEECMKMFNDVFAPKSGEKILFLVDKPHGIIKDTDKWKSRREMAQNWFRIFSGMGENIGFSVDFLEFKATGMSNKPIAKEIIDAASKNNLIIAMTEYSASSSLKRICQKRGTITRCASMPGVEKRMEQSAFKANYSDVYKYAFKPSG